MKLEDIVGTEYSIGGGWGCHVDWLKPEQFYAATIEDNALFDCWGHYTPLPKIGDTLRGEFKKSWIWFRFVEVKYQRDPTDMFFAKVTPIRQEMK